MLLFIWSPWHKLFRFCVFMSLDDSSCHVSSSYIKIQIETSRDCFKCLSYSDSFKKHQKSVQKICHDLSEFAFIFRILL